MKLPSDVNQSWVSSENLTGMDPRPSSQGIGRLEFLVGIWTEDLCSVLVVSQRLPWFFVPWDSPQGGWQLASSKPVRREATERICQQD